MPAGEDVTLGEVARNLDALAKQMERGFERVDERFNTLAMVHSDVYLADRAADHERHKATIARIETIERAAEELKESNQWVWRTVVGAAVAAIAAAVLAAGGFPH